MTEIESEIGLATEIESEIRLASESGSWDSFWSDRKWLNFGVVFFLCNSNNL